MMLITMNARRWSRAGGADGRPEFLKSRRPPPPPCAGQPDTGSPQKTREHNQQLVFARAGNESTHSSDSARMATQRFEGNSWPSWWPAQHNERMLFALRIRPITKCRSD
jgi:hypothetical protein